MVVVRGRHQYGDREAPGEGGEPMWRGMSGKGMTGTEAGGGNASANASFCFDMITEPSSSASLVSTSPIVSHPRE